MTTLPAWLVAACLIPIAFGIGCAAAAVLTTIADLAARIGNRKEHP